ncbi:HK97 family phage prohead protease [Natroniella acetigena]|uniref:HK97 family phage prohead protease n=1 Tax=Natroniella acetigena TaxID=52004 RepID=UPI00200B9500|nr:HK97 family phage prohead protease [Natroniella acetigena]MCK8826399.1 HK97 family phage prohead protease [Natroniella acetigena]
MSKPEQRSIPIENIEVREQDGEGMPVIEMYPAVFNSWSEELAGFRERILPGAFEEAIRENDVIACFNHDKDQLLGRLKSGTLTLEEDERGLRAEIQPPDTDFGRYIVELIDRGDIDGGSFRFNALEENWNFKDGEELDERELVKLELFDVGPVTYPAYPDTQASVRSTEQVHQEARKSTKDYSRDLDVLKRELEIMELEI